MANFSDRIKVAVDFVTDGANKGIRDMRTEIAAADGAFGKLKAAGSGAFSMLKASPVTAAAAIGVFTIATKTAINAASDLGESMNAVDVTFGTAADGIHELGETSATAFGLSEAAFNSAAVAFSSFASTIAGPGGDVAATMDDLVGRATDFASVMNLDVNDAMALFQSTLAGESEPIRKYGIDVSAAAVEHYALAAGLVKSKSEMTEAVKVQARYGLVMQATAKDAGDFVNTSDGLANSQRILSAQITDLAADFGKRLIPAVAETVGTANKLIQAWNTLASSKPVELVLDFKLPGSGSNIGGIIGDAVKRAVSPVEQAKFIVDGYGDAWDDVFGSGGSIDKSAAATSMATSQINDSIQGALDANRELIETHHQLDDVAQDQTKSYEMVQESIEDGTRAVEEQYRAYHEWADTLNASVETAASGLSSFSDEASSSIDDFQADLWDNIAAVANWKNNLVAIVNATSDADFGAWAAEVMSPEVLQQLADSPDELAQTYDLYVSYTEQMGRDVGKEVDKLPGILNEALVKARAETLANAQGIGLDLSSGIAAGILASSGSVEEAARRVVGAAATAAKNAGKIHSPSQLFNEEVGQPIAEGIAEGVVEKGDKITEALTKSIESGEKAAIDAAEHLVDAVQDSIGDIWKGIHDEQSEDDLRDAVADAEDALADALSGAGVKAAKKALADAKAGAGVSDAQAALAGVRGDTGAIKDAEADLAEAKRTHSTSARLQAERDLADAQAKHAQDVADAVAAVNDAKVAKEEDVADAERKLAEAKVDQTEAVVDAQDRLENANRRLAEATTDQITADAESRASWIKTAKAGGLTAKQIAKITHEYDRLRMAKEEAAASTAEINAEVGSANQVNGRFGTAVAQGLITGDDLDVLGKLDPAAQLSWMKQKLNDLDAWFGNVPQYAAGTMNHPGGLARINERGGEIVDLPNGSRVYPAGKGPTGFGTININTRDDPNAIRREIETMMWKAGAR